MSTFQVEVQELTDVSTRMRRLIASLGNVRKFGHEFYYGHSGAKEIDAALDHFFSNWSQGMSAACKNLDGLADGLDQSATAYRKAESKVAAQCGKGGE